MQANLIDFDDLSNSAEAAHSDGHQRSQSSIPGIAEQQQQTGTDPAAATDDLFADFCTSIPAQRLVHPANKDPFATCTNGTPLKQGAGQPFEMQQGQVQQHDSQASHTSEQQAQGELGPGAADQSSLQQQPCASCSATNSSLLPVCERVACLGQLLQQHGAAQGEANASIRLLLATISAKQVKTRQLLAGISVSQQQRQTNSGSSGVQLQQELNQQLQQQVLQLQQQLAASQSDGAEARAELAAASAELVQLKAEQQQQAELLSLQEAELNDLRRAEQGYQTEISGLQERLLEAQADLSRLSASLPGGRSRRRQDNDNVNLDDDDEFPTAFAGFDAAETDGFASPFTPVDGKVRPSAFADPAAAAAAGEGNQAANSVSSSRQAPAEAGFATPAKQLTKKLSQRSSLLTPDQANIQQLKNWLHESQSALMKAQEDLMDNEALVKQLMQQLAEQQQKQQEGADKQEQQPTGAVAAEPLAQISSVEYDALRDEVVQLRAEFTRVTAELEEAEAARIATLAKLQDAQEAAKQQEQQQEQLLQGSAPNADNERHEAAAAAAAEVAALQQQLTELQEQRDVVATEVALLQQQLKQLQVQQGQQPDTTCVSEQESAATAAAARAAAAETELVAARAAAEAAAAEVAALQWQLLELQQQQQQQRQAAASVEAGLSSGSASSAEVEVQGTNGLVSPAVSSQSAEMIGHSTDVMSSSSKVVGKIDKQTAEAGSAEYQLLRAISEKQALHSELADTKQRLLLLVQLVKKGAAAAGTGLQSQTSLQQQGPLPGELAGLLDGDSSADITAADADDVTVLMQLVEGLEQRYCRGQQLQQLLLRGKEMQFLLENALEQVHLLKEAGGVSCACPTEAEYQQLAAAVQSDAAVAAAVAQSTSVVQSSAPATDAAIVDIEPSSSKGVAELLSLDRPYHDGVEAGQLHIAHASIGQSLIGDPVGLHHSQQQHPVHGATTPSSHPGSSCSSDVLRVSGAGSSSAALAVVDEGLGYGGLDDAWWNKSSVESVTDLPDFLIKK